MIDTCFVNVLDLNSLPSTLPSWSGNQTRYFVEGLSVGLEKQGNRNGTILRVLGDVEFDLNLEWNECLVQVEKSWQEPKKIAEAGATALAFLLCEKLTEFIPESEAVIGTGVDYWLCYKEGHEKYDELNFMNARLEISGINKETSTNSIDGRVKIKRKQVTKSDDTSLPVYISVSEFGTPKSYFAKK